MAQNIEFKKSTLDDDASIYQKKEERDDAKTTQEKWSSLNKTEKWKYFKDYYLTKIIIAVVVVVFVGYSIYTSFRDNYTTKYNVTVLNELFFDNRAMEEHLSQLEKKWGFEEKEKAAYSVDMSLNNNSDKATFVTYLSAGSMNAVIGKKDNLENYGGQFIDYSEILPAEIYNSIPEEAWCDLTFRDPDSDTVNPVVSTARCGLYINHTIFADNLSENMPSDDIILVFPITGSTKDAEIDYNLEFFKYAIGYEK